MCVEWCLCVERFCLPMAEEAMPMGEEALPPAEAVDVGDGLLKVWPSGPAREMNALLDSAQRYLEEEECKVCLTEVEATRRGRQVGVARPTA